MKHHPLHLQTILRRKKIVFESNLLQLFDTCPHCAHPSQSHIVDKPNSGFGTMVRVEQRCMDCEFTRKLDSQPMLKQMPLGNLMLSASILFSGSQISQVLRMLHIFNVATYSRQTFQRHQNDYVIPTIINGWKEKQADLIAELKENQIHLAGDRRNNSPCHSAKYGTYTFIEQTSKKVVDLQQVQSSEACSSNACELFGFKRGVSFLTEQLTCRGLVTDRHRSIAAFIRDDLKVNNPMCAEMDHFNDVWHTAKGLGKKTIKIGTKQPEVNLWKKSIVNHMYFVAATAPKENRRDHLKDRWLSLDNHLRDIHENDLDLNPMCDHGHLLYDRNKEWFVRGTVGSAMLTDLLTSNAVVKDVQNLTPRFQTSSLEAFHSLGVRFAPKHIHFGWLGQLARTYLAAMHHNENANRMQAITRNGLPQYRVSFPKYKSGHQN
ncbi:hypothetical protein LOTGIDRAFT_116126 [Lottia gigantea]|uniref:Uncharacterized protein n=1 Tax=Lottia gigantea TaxID=225164 RepID=V4AGR9_LOTGI|nr:hypothetical protein LOTGIDRAFT_116126 [Lottia gigantea]ESO96097.1 hypothetical protein LOTGIDRAFT_116126 [Lottia gigantea]